ncbi:SDR family NAD(P)-dependent oxidoreductase [Thermopolyspora sp. NPDC052614]|uniref:SDR family NAD(P)-dependent oxidoreductase n=1 Tax=Thermopolyspora sp. NPDC052614 TaxID=3155682 RepID=UPI00343BC748
MRNFVIVGGTDGMGRALARHYVTTGDAVMVVGRNAAKGKGFLAEAGPDARDRAHFVQADLSTLAGQRTAAAQIARIFPVVDGLVFTAQRFHSTRMVTEDGYEATFALYYLARKTLGDALVPLLEKAPQPVVVNVCGPGVKAGEMHWDDLQLTQGYAGLKAMMQGSRANDLLGIGFTQEHPDSRISYVLYNPVFVATSFSGDYSKPVAVFITIAKKLLATPVDKGVQPIIGLIDNPPAERISAWKKRTRLPLDTPAFNPDDAARLRQITADLLASHS